MGTQFTKSICQKAVIFTFSYRTSIFFPSTVWCKFGFISNWRLVFSVSISLAQNVSQFEEEATIHIWIKCDLFRKCVFGMCTNVFKIIPLIKNRREMQIWDHMHNQVNRCIADDMYIHSVNFRIRWQHREICRKYLVDMFTNSQKFNWNETMKIYSPDGANEFVFSRKENACY